MKSINSTRKEDQQDESYPVLKEFRSKIGNSYMVVLFTGQSTGTLVNRNEKCVWEMGHYSGEWEESQFRVFDGTISLKN